MKHVLVALVSLVACGLATAAVQPPVLQYTPRYVFHQLDTETIAVLDTAEGKVWTALLTQYGFKAWRAYDLNAIAKERNMPDVGAPAGLGQRLVYGRYTVRLFPTFITFFDTLTGRMWTCRHSKGVLDVWRCRSVTGGGEE